jgi:hypothetical protein
MSAALHKVVHEVLGDDLTLAEAKQMLAEVDARNDGKLSLSEVRTGDRGGLLSKLDACQHVLRMWQRARLQELAGVMRCMTSSISTHTVAWSC